MSFLKQHAKLLTLILLVLVGIVITAPNANFQDFLSQGDHGRDLYAAQAVYRGELPYKDFWWVYGPLTPYYYGLFFKVFGVKISSMLLGKLILRIAGGILICLGLMELTSMITAFICGSWFMLFAQDFFFTYNHLAGIVMVLGVAWCLLAYIQKSTLRSAWGALGFIFILCLIKINFGLMALAVSVFSIAVCDKVNGINFDNSKKLFYASACLALPLVIFMIYWSLLKGLSVTEIRQCLPYMDGDQPYAMNMWIAIGNFISMTYRTATSNWTNITFALIMNISFIRCIYLLIRDQLPANRKRILLLSIGMLAIFYAANFHEYLKSGVWYRGFWSQPLSMMMTFILIDTALQSIPQWGRKIVYLILGYLAIFSAISIERYVNSQKTPDHLLSIQRGNIYTTNSPSWMTCVKGTTEFLEKTLKPNELFFALPYDCLYYYLTDKKTPTRQLIFFEHIKITTIQERSVIAKLEKNRVNYVLVSSRAFAGQEPGLGFLGKTYCPILGKYIQDNFKPVGQFGDWTNEPGWAWNHGTIILKRKKAI